MNRDENETPRVSVQHIFTSPAIIVLFCLSLLCYSFLFLSAIVVRSNLSIKRKTAQHRETDDIHRRFAGVKTRLSICLKVKQTSAEIFIYPLSAHRAARSESHVKIALSDADFMPDDARGPDAEPTVVDLHISTEKMVKTFLHWFR